MMKKAITYSLAISSVLALSALTIAAAPVYECKMTPTPITIDGKVDGQWKTAPVYSLKADDAIINEFGKVWDTVNSAGNFRILWDSKYAYWSFEVKDNEIVVDVDDSGYWNRDAVAGYLSSDAKDVNYKFFTSPGEDPHTCIGTISGGVAADESIKTAYTTSKDGYVIEVAVPWSLANNGVPAIGDVYKMTTLMVDKNDTWGQLMWIGDGDNPEAYGDMKFTK
jgi:hypothetical protein